LEWRFGGWIEERLASELYAEEQDWFVHKVMNKSKRGRPTFHKFMNGHFVSSGGATGLLNKFVWQVAAKQAKDGASRR
jgi:hypothetical protein